MVVDLKADTSNISSIDLIFYWDYWPRDQLDRDLFYHLPSSV